MKITLAKHGGGTAGMPRPPRVIDLSSLPKEAVAEFEKLISAARSAATPGGTGPGKARDAMSYVITIEGDGPAERFEQSDTTMSEEFAELMHRIERP